MKQLRNHRGFAMPVTLLALVVMSVLAVALLYTSVDEQRASRAVRLSVEAFYAAEAGANAVQAVWNDTTQTLDSLSGELTPGDSILIGGGAWQSLGNGARYRATVTRVDSGGGSQRLYVLSVDGRHGDARAPLRVMYTPAGDAGGGTVFGECCDAAATVRGEVKISDTDDSIDGHDGNPSGWTAAECPTTEDKTGMIMQETDDLLDMDGTLDGVPALQEDPTLTDEDFTEFGELGWADFKAMANYSFNSVGGGQIKLDIAPKYTGGGTVCDTSHDTNWGWWDPNDPCFDWWPIILIKGEVEMKTGYGQGIVILDLLDPVTGSEFELEGGNFAGLIVGLGCIEIQDGSQFWGSVFVNGDFDDNNLCNEDPPFRTHDDGNVTWSSCAIRRSLESTGVGALANPGKGALKLSRHLERLLQ